MKDYTMEYRGKNVPLVREGSRGSAAGVAFATIAGACLWMSTAAPGIFQRFDEKKYDEHRAAFAQMYAHGSREMPAVSIGDVAQVTNKEFVLMRAYQDAIACHPSNRAYVSNIAGIDCDGDRDGLHSPQPALNTVQGPATISIPLKKDFEAYLQGLERR